MALRKSASAPLSAIPKKATPTPRPQAKPNKASPKIDIHLGDCLHVLQELPENSVHLVVTDPPYFLHNLDSDWDSVKISNGFKQAKTIKNLPAGMKFDIAQADRLREFYALVAQEVRRVLVPGGFFLSFSQPRLSFATAQAVHESGFEVRDIYTWHYTTKSQFKAFSQDHFIDRMKISAREKTKIKASMQGRKTPQLRPLSELIVMAQKPKEGTFVENWRKWGVGLIDATQRLDGGIPSTVMEVEPATIMTVEKSVRDKYNGHLTVKPVRLMEHLIRVFSCEGQTVLDPFLGSGTTAIAARRANRNCIGIEINPSYIEIAEQRIREAVA